MPAIREIRDQNPLSARIIANPAGLEKIWPTHLAEALQYRPRLNSV